MLGAAEYFVIKRVCYCTYASFASCGAEVTGANVLQISEKMIVDPTEFCAASVWNVLEECLTLASALARKGRLLKKEKHILWMY